MQSIVSTGPNFGLDLILGKCEVFWLSGDQSFPELPCEIRYLLKELTYLALQCMALISFSSLLLIQKSRRCLSLNLSLFY